MLNNAALTLERFVVPDAPLNQRIEPTEGYACPDTGALASELVPLLAEKGLSVATAESLTGGLVCATLTSVSGSSAVVKGGVVSYATEIKHAVLGVDAAVLATDGPVSSDSALQMAQGACRVMDCDIAVSVTGIAGPSGDEPGKPVGTVYVGSAMRTGIAKYRRYCFPGDREEVRAFTVAAALVALFECL